jgi:hypothetical protein
VFDPDVNVRTQFASTLESVTVDALPTVALQPGADTVAASAISPPMTTGIPEIAARLTPTKNLMLLL